MPSIGSAELPELHALPLPSSLWHIAPTLLWLQGLFYNTFPKKVGPQSGELGTETDANLNQRLSYHVLGTTQEENNVILGNKNLMRSWQ